MRKREHRHLNATRKALIILLTAALIIAFGFQGTVYAVDAGSTEPPAETTESQDKAEKEESVPIWNYTTGDPQSKWYDGSETWSDNEESPRTQVDESLKEGEDYVRTYAFTDKRAVNPDDPSLEWKDSARGMNQPGFIWERIEGRGKYMSVKEIRHNIMACIKIAPDSLGKDEGETDPQLTYKMMVVNDAPVDFSAYNIKFSREKGEEPGTYKVTGRMTFTEPSEQLTMIIDQDIPESGLYVYRVVGENTQGFLQFQIYNGSFLINRKEVTPPVIITPTPTPTEEHTVSFSTGGGSEVPSQTVPSGGKAVKPDDPTKDGYTFQGWYTEAEAENTYDFNTPVTKSFTLYAKWEKVNEPVKPDKPNKPKPSRKVTGILLPKVKASGTTQTLTWTRLTNVDGYFIYRNHCDEGKKLHPFKKVADYKASRARVYVRKNLKRGHNYKYYVAAYKIKNGKKVIVRNSVTVHSVAGNTSYRSTNVKAVKAAKHSITLKKGKSTVLRAAVTKYNSRKSLLDSTHCAKLRYLSADSSIASVNYNTGKITGKKAGTTTVYVLGVNGYRDKTKVTVR